MISLSLEELKIIAKFRKVRNYKKKSTDELMKILSKPKPEIEEIRKKLMNQEINFLKSKITEIRKNLYEIETKNNLSSPKIKKIEKSLVELEKNLFKRKKYYDGIEYKGIRDLKNLFDLLFDEDYYKSIVTNDGFNSSYTEYESNGDIDKTLSIKEYLYMNRPYLSNIIHDHKTQGEWKVHSSNAVIDYKTQKEWKIQLTMTIYFISSKDSHETRTMHTNSNNIEIMMGNETDEFIR